ncbi:hypothetical protein N0V90_010544 [Kalmusia sp. IMI 367209]|nr:hypothetical protein N0V90_010544 [Kalmusia sp. IMI 367209]
MDEFDDLISFDTAVNKVSIPEDDLDFLPMAPGTILYLTVATPHTDAWQWYGPFTKFEDLIKRARMIIKTSPSTKARLKKAMEPCEPILAYTTEPAKEPGFTQLVLQGAKDKTKFSVLNVVRMANADVHKHLPLNVFTVTCTGPLTHDIHATLGTVQSGQAKGRATTSCIIGSYTDRKDALTAAKATMADLLAPEPEPKPKASYTFPPLDAGAGIIVTTVHAMAEKTANFIFQGKGASADVDEAMSSRMRWEVSVHFETDGLAGARQRFDEDEGNVVRGRKASYRTADFGV